MVQITKIEQGRKLENVLYDITEYRDRTWKANVLCSTKEYTDRMLEVNVLYKYVEM